jgi:hypothetical protein
MSLATYASANTSFRRIVVRVCVPTRHALVLDVPACVFVLACVPG